MCLCVWDTDIFLDKTYNFFVEKRVLFNNHFLAGSQILKVIIYITISVAIRSKKKKKKKKRNLKKKKIIGENVYSKSQFFY